ncbi:M48 family metalloprotease [Natronolimnobius sp. AArcel1]|uniref:M48 family metallopeptidase n=1 Tax=Natronolimnobius sp. AArcel1 TaxID=1679093 RepID=UPI0013EC4B88|nr:M48 family metalloprotease [Natronolimnobius sp. AArcel1]NGM69654.1 M48 family metalloprotease [Natronolimnobius sp. AArcel1]
MNGRSLHSLRVRLAATLALLVALAVGVVATVAWATYTLVGAVGGARATAVSDAGPLLAGLLVLAACVLVVAHSRYGYRRVLESVEATPLEDGDSDPHGLRDRVRRFAQAADVETPRVAVAPEREPTSFTIGNGTDATVVVTEGLLEALSADELEAVLAHEVAHLANRDATVATVAATVGSISEGLFARERRIGTWLQFLLTIGSITVVLVLVAIPILVLSVVYLLVSVLARVVLAVGAVTVGIHAQTREYAADRAGAELAGDPAALASALETLAAAGPPETDARTQFHASSTLGIVPYALTATDDITVPSSLARWVPDADSELDRAAWVRGLSRGFGRVGRALEWRPSTHPPVAERVERLRQQARES